MLINKLNLVSVSHLIEYEISLFIVIYSHFSKSSVVKCVFNNLIINAGFLKL